MNKRHIFSGVFFTIIATVLIVLVVYFDKNSTQSPTELYKVYLEGKSIGLISDANDLYDLIDTEQETLKTDYNVDKIYPPNSLEVSTVVTYDEDIHEVKEIYDEIKDEQPFTVKGYIVTIGEENPVTFNVLSEGIFEKSIDNIVKTFVDEASYKAYQTQTQQEIKDEGKYIEKVYIEENITIKDTYISTKEHIYKDEDELTRFLLFGKIEKQKTYTVKTGDTLETVASNNKLNVRELLIVNPDIISENALLFPGQKVNVSPIHPLITIVKEETSIENQKIRFETQIKYDNSQAYGTTEVRQKGVNGVTRVTFRTMERNGVVTSAVRMSSEQIVVPIDQIIVKGGNNIVYVGDSKYWAWPTLSTYVMSDLYGWRTLNGEPNWHAGIDICVGSGSPIFSVQNGTIAETGYKWDMGNYVYINHNNGYYTVYMHLKKIYVKEGQNVIKGERIGLMGNTGLSYGAHLHFGVFTGYPTKFVNDINPYSLYR